MGRYKYPFIPREYYPAVMYACQCIRKYGTFNVAVNAAAKAYSVDADIVAKYVRERQGAGQKGKTRKYKYYVVEGWSDRWVWYYDVDILFSQLEPEEWKRERKPVAIIIKATDIENAIKKVPKGTFARDGRLYGDVITDEIIIEYDSEREAKERIAKIAE